MAKIKQTFCTKIVSTGPKRCLSSETLEHQGAQLLNLCITTQTSLTPGLDYDKESDCLLGCEKSVV